MKLIIDGGFFFMKSLFSIKTPKSITESLLNSKFDNSLRDLLRLNDDRNLHFCADFGSWRKQAYSEYKANRKKKEDDMTDFDWTLIRKAQNDWLYSFKTYNGNLIKIRNAEADDAIAVVCLESEKKCKSSLIISADRDLNQLLSFSDNCWIAQLDAVRNRIFVHENFNEKISDFEKIFNVHSDLYNFIDMKGLEVIKINPHEHLLRKILSGDLGDNLESAYSKKVAKKSGSEGERTKRLSGKKLEIVIEEFKEFFNEWDCFLNDNSFERLSYKIAEIMKDDESQEEIFRNIKRNNQLMNLHSQIPKEISEACLSALSSSEIDVSSFFDRDISSIFTTESEEFDDSSWIDFL